MLLPGHARVKTLLIRLLTDSRADRVRMYPTVPDSLPLYVGHPGWATSCLVVDPAAVVEGSAIHRPGMCSAWNSGGMGKDRLQRDSESKTTLDGDLCPCVLRIGEQHGKAAAWGIGHELALVR